MVALGLAVWAERIALRQTNGIRDELHQEARL